MSFTCSCWSNIIFVLISLALPSRSANIQPVLAVDFPDPALVELSNSSWLAFATSGGGSNVQIAASPSFVNPEWRLFAGDPLPDPGPWAKNDRNVWAPDVIQLVRISSSPPADLTYLG